MAVGVTANSPAARLKLRCLAAASKALKAVTVGKRDMNESKSSYDEKSEFVASHHNNKIHLWNDP
jgi:hypothetical protein